MNKAAFRCVRDQTYTIQHRHIHLHGETVWGTAYYGYGVLQFGRSIDMFKSDL